MSAERRWTEREMVDALWAHWTGRYAVLTQVPTIAVDEERTAAYKTRGVDYEALRYRRIDMLLISRNRRGGVPWERIAVEIKVSRADFLAEQRDPSKAQAWREIAHRFIYAVPAGLIQPSEVPDGVGLVEVSRTTHFDPEHPYYDVQWARRAKRPGGTAVGDLGDWFWPYIAGRVDRAESAIAGRGVDALTREEPGLLAANLRQARASVERLTERLHAEQERSRAAITAAVAADGKKHTCIGCGEIIRVDPGRYGGQWVHCGTKAARKALDDACTPTLLRLADDAASAAWVALDADTRNLVTAHYARRRSWMGSRNRDLYPGEPTTAWQSIRPVHPVWPAVDSEGYETSLLEAAHDRAHEAAAEERTHQERDRREERRRAG